MTDTRGIYRAPGGSGDAVADTSNESITAINAAADAEASKIAAGLSADSASVSATNAANSAISASTSATNSANSASAAQTAESNAETAETNAETAQAAAELAEDNAVASASLANEWATKTSGPVAGGEYSAKYNAQQAATSASSASTSASSASSSASAASTSASSAATSATNASNSASAASTSASNAATSATNAASSATSAAASATLAASYTPDQTGNSGKFLTTNGSVTSWGTITSNPGTVTSVDMSVPIGLSISGNPITSNGTLAVTYATGYSLPTNIKQGQWDTAYSWGNHASAGYLTSYTETDPIFVTSAAYGITSTDKTHWSTAYSWGDHASAGYLSSADIGSSILAYDSNLQSFVSTFTLPTIDSTSGYVLSTDGAGTLSWVANGSGGGGGGTVTDVSVVSANGFAGTVATSTTTPAITISTSVTGLLKGNGTAVSAAASGTDYAPATSGTAILYGNGSGGFSNVTIGSNLTFTGGTLSASGGGGGGGTVGFEQTFLLMGA